MKWVDFVREIGSGNGVAAVASSLKRHVDDVEIETVNSDSDGLISYDINGHPGPIYHEETVAGQTIVRSSKAMGTIFLAEVPYALTALGEGVVADEGNELEVYGDSSGMQVKVKTGVALVKGHIYRGVTEQTLTIGANATGDPRIDRIIVRLTRPGQTEEGKVEAVVLAGTAAASPSAPSLTQTAATWEISLAQVAVASGAATITAGNVTDERTMLPDYDSMQTQLDAKQPLAALLTAIAAGSITGFVQIAMDSQNAANTGTNPSDAVYNTAVDVDLTLPTGTWTVLTVGGALFRQQVDGQINVRARIDANAGAVSSPTVDSDMRTHVIVSHLVTGVSSGARACSIQYKNGSGFAGDASASQVWIVAIAIRTA